MMFPQSDVEILTDTYAKYFDVVRANDPDLLDRAFRLRYQVYCVENPFENAAEHPDGREVDADDDRSIHALLVHRPTGATAGTVRIIRPIGGKARPLPVERVIGSQCSGLASDLKANVVGEISRFAISKEFRRRCGEHRYADVGFSGDSVAMAERRLLPFITYGLIRGALEICWDYQVDHLYAVMEPALLRLLARIGLSFNTIGAPVEYHGIRQPCIATVADLVEQARCEPLLWRCTAEPVKRRAYECAV
jgi:N-acyl amino acid synthase of PEP-CTERM/exosortase system